MSRPVYILGINCSPGAQAFEPCAKRRILRKARLQ